VSDLKLAYLACVVGFAGFLRKEERSEAEALEIPVTLRKEEKVTTLSRGVEQQVRIESANSKSASIDKAVARRDCAGRLG
jgi:hypothetical protein